MPPDPGRSGRCLLTYPHEAHPHGFGRCDGRPVQHPPLNRFEGGWVPNDPDPTPGRTVGDDADCTQDCARHTSCIEARKRRRSHAPMPDARTVGENGVALRHVMIADAYFPDTRELATHVAFPKDEAAEILRLAAWAREVAALMHIGLERPPEEVFEYFRRELGIEAPDAI